MKTLLSLITIVFLLNIPFSLAQHKNHHHNHEEGLLDETKQIKVVKGAACENTINVKVNGLVCDFCARALEKVFDKRNDVSGINVDLNDGKVDIFMAEGKTIDDDTLTRLITDSGYNVVDIDKGC